MPQPDPDRLVRIARQHAHTSRLLGVDFLPRRSGAPPVSVPVPAIDEPPPPSEAPSRLGVVVASRDSDAKRALLDALRARHDKECPHCTRATTHTKTVFSDGDPGARLMFVGEAPGADEDRTGIPFVGKAGQLLNQMIVAMGLTREGVYIANVLKARPPNNDTPTSEEAARCGPYLKEQVRIVAPAAIVTLGNPATQYLLETKQGITSLRGRWQAFEGIPVMPTFHPAFLLRQYTPENRRLVWSDLQAVMQRLNETTG